MPGLLHPLRGGALQACSLQEAMAQLGGIYSGFKV